MKTSAAFRFLSTLVLVVWFTALSFGQSPKRVYSQVYYHKIKPGHTFAEARAMENEFKKIHQFQVNEGSINGWYMLALDMTTNPNKEYDYITINTFSDPGYIDNPYPQTTMEKVMGSDYQTKTNDLYKRMQDVKEVVKSEVWENLEEAVATPRLAPDKSPVWVLTSFKVKNDQYEKYMEKVKKGKAVIQEQINMSAAAGWSFMGLMYPWSNETSYDFAAVNQFPTMRALLDDSKLEVAFKKAMPGVDQKQYYKELDALRGPARQEVYYLMDFAVKTPANKRAIQLDPAQLDAYVGVYEGPFGSNPKTLFFVTREGNQLFDRIEQEKIEMYPESQSRFFFKIVEAQLEFIKDASGKVVKRILTYGGQTTEAKKIK